MLTCCLRFHSGRVTMALRIFTSYCEHFACSYEYLTNIYVYFKYSNVSFTFWGKGIKAANLNTSFSVVIFWLKFVRTRKYS